MSAPLFAADVLFSQRLLKSAGFYDGKLDGLYGPMTRAAEAAFDTEYDIQRSARGGYDARSEKLIATLLPAMQIKARDILGIAKTREAITGLHCTILSGTRTWAEQDRLYAQGRTALGSIVTNAKGGFSNHNMGIAIDVGLFQGARYLTGAKKGDDAAYRELAAAVKHDLSGVEWGGDWHTIVDLPHYQLATGKSLAQVRQAFAAGLPLTV